MAKDLSSRAAVGCGVAVRGGWGDARGRGGGRVHYRPGLGLRDSGAETARQEGPAGGCGRGDARAGLARARDGLGQTDARLRSRPRCSCVGCSRPVCSPPPAPPALRAITLHCFKECGYGGLTACEVPGRERLGGRLRGRWATGGSTAA